MPINDLVFHRVLRDSLNSTLNAPVITTANHAAICAAFRKMNERTISPYIQGRLSGPISYLEEIRDAKEVIKEGIEILTKLGNDSLELGRNYHSLGVEYRIFGYELVEKVKLGASIFLAFATAGAFLYSGKFVYDWWTTAPSPPTPTSVGAYEILVQHLLNKKDFAGALKTLGIMVDNEFVPSRTTLEDVLHAILVDKKVNIAGKILKLAEELSVDSKLVCDVIVVLFWKGKAETALKRMRYLSQLDLDRIVVGLIGAEKKPSPMTALRLFSFLVSKKEVVLGVRLLGSGLLSGAVIDSHLIGLLDTLEGNQGAVLCQSELDVVKKFREQFLASSSN